MSSSIRPEQDIAHSKSIIDDFVSAGISAMHLDAYTPDEERKEIITKFRDGKIQVLSSVNVLGIGFDVPSASCAILARPTQSEALHIQQMGRVIRSCEGKKDALILDHAGNTVRFGLPIHFEVPDLTDGDYESGTVKAKKEDKLVICGNCSSVLEPDMTQCPQCGMDRQVKKSEVVHADGQLIEYGSNNSGEIEFTHQDKREWYAGLLWHTERKGFKRGWANHKFKEKFGDWPNFRSVTPTAPTQEVSNWLKYQQIKWAKSQNKTKKQISSTQCPACKSNNVEIKQGTGPHAAGMKCNDCGSHRWLSKDNPVQQKVGQS